MIRLLIAIFLGFPLFVGAADQAVFTDSLQNGWEDWSWAARSTVSTPVHSGTKSFSVTAGAWQAAYFHNSSVDASLYTNLTFWIHGGSSGGQKLLISGLSAGSQKLSVDLPTLTANSWQQITVSLQSLGIADDPAFDGFWIQDRTGTAQPTFYLDDITLVAGATPPPATNSIVAVQIDAARNRHPISDLIYGVAFASSNQLKELNVPLNRSGGNTATRYNWQQNASNHAFDWYFESLEESSSTAGASVDSFIRNSKSGGAEAMITIPTIGWVAKLGAGRARLSSFSISKYGAQEDSDSQWFPDAGNGIKLDGTYITNNDPNDASALVDSTFQQNWARHLTNLWGTSANGGVRYYIMDNEPSIWFSTHRDVFKTGLKMSELRDRVIDYASKIRAVDPGAIIVGPEEWGWSGYLYSGYDQQWGSSHGWSNLPDRGANGGKDYLPWFLAEMKKHRDTTGEALLDIFTVHYYPQGGEYSSDVSTTMQLRRNRSTRSLWDTNYVDQTWISDKVRLIPRLKEWVAQNYPGLKIGITEYSWGADNHINGATAQADVLGILGREELDVATRWVVPDIGTPAYKSIQMYRNYDGQKSVFGDVSVSSIVPNPDNVAVFAAERSLDHVLTIMAINKTTATTPVSLALTNFAHRGTAQVWQLTSSNQIQKLADVSFSGNELTNTLPAQSITLFVVPKSSASSAPRFNSVNTIGNVVNFEVSGSSGEIFTLQSSSDFAGWADEKRVTLSGANTPVSVSATNNQRFYRLTAP